MFLFEKLAIYQKSLEYCSNIYTLFKKNNIDTVLKNQLQRASTSISLNIAEGSGRFTQRDKNSFYINARGSILECVSIFQILLKTEQIQPTTYKQFYSDLEELSKMISGLIKQ